MMWKTIGESVIGTSHMHTNKQCEDAIYYTSFKISSTEEVLICAVSDGAGSAKYAAEASKYVTEKTVRKIEQIIHGKLNIDEVDIFPIAEELYSELKGKASQVNEPLNEFSCTLLGCVVFSNKALFFQVGDGAIVRNDGAGYYTNLWWPHNGEYQNTTSFFIDDENFSQFKILQIEESINEIAIFSDGLQLLILNTETQSVHQPFFKNVFQSLRLADNENSLAILKKKLANYLESDLINSRTDDDKTLFLATRLNNEQSNIQGQ